MNISAPMRMKNEMREMIADCYSGYFLNDDGKCEECAVGWTGHNCMDLCPQGWFGRNCSSRCFCWSEFCDPERGKCLSDTVRELCNYTFRLQF
uniref:TIL domain-containing protein n=1 Tax=Ascaris lumbricoides TaxID=6252 RepID=A0A0M3IV96_ASCLU